MNSKEYQLMIIINNVKNKDIDRFCLCIKEFLIKDGKIKKYPYCPDLYKKLIKHCFIREVNNA